MRGQSTCVSSFCKPYTCLYFVILHGIHTPFSHRPIDTLLAACGTMGVSEDMTPFISRMRDLSSSAPAAATAAAAAARKSLDFPILLSFIITTLMAFLFQSMMMRNSNSMSVAAAVVYAAAPATLIYPHRLVRYTFHRRCHHGFQL